jgi:succinoglycan biosynthesis protein ExoA
MVLTPFAGIFAVPALAWTSLCIGYGIVLGARLHDACAAAAGVAAMAMQAGWSFGFFRGLIAELRGGARITSEAELKPRRQNQVAR